MVGMDSTRRQLGRAVARLRSNVRSAEVPGFRRNAAASERSALKNLRAAYAALVAAEDELGVDAVGRLSDSLGDLRRRAVTARLVAEGDAERAMEDAAAAPEPSGVRVVVVGPNLRDQSRGDFHVHRVGCADLRRDPNLRGEDQSMVFEARTREDVAEAVYGDQMAEAPAGSAWAHAAAYVAEFHFAPCCGLGG